MAVPSDPKDLHTPQELAVSNAYEIATLVSVLDREGILKQQEVLAEITRLKAKTGKV